MQLSLSASKQPFPMSCSDTQWFKTVGNWPPSLSWTCDLSQHTHCCCGRVHLSSIRTGALQEPTWGPTPPPRAPVSNPQMRPDRQKGCSSGKMCEKAGAAMAPASPPISKLIVICFSPYCSRVRCFNNLPDSSTRGGNRVLGEDSEQGPHPVKQPLRQLGPLRCFPPAGAPVKCEAPCSQTWALHSSGDRDGLSLLTARLSEPRFPHSNGIYLKGPLCRVNEQGHEMLSMVVVSVSHMEKEH